MTSYHLVPPHPQLVNQLYARYRELIQQKRLSPELTFQQFYSFWRSSRRGADLPGLDDGYFPDPAATHPYHFISRPSKILNGVIRTIVLLVDFEDQPANGNYNPAFYEQMLFGEPGVFPTGSMREYYRTISNFDADQQKGIDIQGEVFGWLRMPHKESYYTNNASGTADSFPRNGQGMAEDAVKVALDYGVDFSAYDNLDDGQITALFIVHAGRGAEQTGNRNDIWSHKSIIPQSVTVSKTPHIIANTYLTVPEDCNMGVCAHEWGHLVACWADYYDTGKFNKSNGLGLYCLMASGSWGHGGLCPTLPNVMLRMFHNWINIEEVTSSTNNLILQPASEGGGGIFIQNPATMKPNQYVVVEYRRRTGWDSALPDEGIAVYLVDESIDNVNDENRLAIELMQADGKRQLSKVLLGNHGDQNDLYPSLGNKIIGRTTNPSLTLSDGKWTGIKIEVLDNPGKNTMRINIEIEA